MHLRTEAEYEAAIHEIETFFDTEVEPGSEEGARLVALMRAVDEYEQTHLGLSATDEAAPVPVQPNSPFVFQISGLKCDAPGCDYRNEDIPLDDYPQWVNRPCPKCSTVLLTEDDLEAVQRIITYTDTMNEIASFGGLGFAKLGGPMEEIEIEIDNGEVTRR